MADQSTYPYEPDQFDREADQVGAHGAHRAEEPFFKRNLSTIIVIVAALVALALVLWAVSGLGKGSENAPAPAESSTSAPADSSESARAPSSESTDEGEQPIEEASEEPSEEPAPEVNKEAPVLVLNGKRVQGMAGRWQKALEEQGWTKIDTDTGKRSKNAGVYYKNDEDQATAEALAKYVGVEAEKTDKYKANITVVIIDEPGDLAEIEGEDHEGDDGE
ncbi:LytR C-terminal domain-containing protein [Dermabacter sp. HSID17554]|uniref:LytR C-terminal domain-containing protein n=1 Tax=Dermabacter sp. HSID17554 TaxID=2419511 RepID=UPI000F87302C|nr:LytR C-terminal domain-containing protein [Dermabacter sp. HSID17554]RUP85673.1 LytR family transcriptional regulator [Dermabacter sp. HSID17554]